MERKIHFLGVALCAVCADLYARALSRSDANPNCQRWLENLFFCARAWESMSFNNLLGQLFQRVSPSFGLQIVAPKLISALWAETIANVGRVQKKNGKFLHNAVACSIDAPCSVEMIWQLGPLALLHISFNGWTDFSWTSGCGGLEASCRQPRKPSSLDATPTAANDHSHFVLPDTQGWFREH